MGDVSPRSYYDRQLRLSGWGSEGQAILGRSTVLVVGVGGLGCPVLTSLARAGVGRLVFVDPDRIDESNLARQTLFSPMDVGRPKAEVAAEVLASANPWIRLEPRSVLLDRSNVRSFVEDADLVVDGTDNFRTKFLVHDACLSAQKPLVLGSLYQWEAQVTVFPFHKREKGCWRCLYTKEPEDGCVGTCAEVGVAGALAGMAGNAQALAAIQTLLGQAALPPLSTWVFDAIRWESKILRWKPKADCGCRRGGGDWSWLAEAEPRKEVDWIATAPEDRQVVVDVREDQEIRSGEWEWFVSHGSRVIHHPWSGWMENPPRWEEGITYLIVCAQGSRSQAALKTVPNGVRALSLAGGVARLKVAMDSKTLSR